MKWYANGLTNLRCHRVKIIAWPLIGSIQHYRAPFHNFPLLSTCSTFMKHEDAPKVISLGMGSLWNFRYLLPQIFFGMQTCPQQMPDIFSRGRFDFWNFFIKKFSGQLIFRVALPMPDLRSCNGVWCPTGGDANRQSTSHGQKTGPVSTGAWQAQTWLRILSNMNSAVIPGGCLIIWPAKKRVPGSRKHRLWAWI